MGEIVLILLGLIFLAMAIRSFTQGRRLLMERWSPPHGARRKKRDLGVIMGLLFLFVLGVWQVGRNCFLALDTGDMIPIVYCDNRRCVCSLQFKAPWSDGPHVYPECPRDSEGRILGLR